VKVLIIRDPVSGLRRKIIIFTEPRDTLEYLQQKISATVGADGVVVIHGGIAREARRAAIAAFNSDPVVRVMIANDAAREGVNPLWTRHEIGMAVRAKHHRFKKQ
jgi:superfamily II DNA/RNA helicase